MSEGHIGFSSEIVVENGEKFAHTSIEIRGATRADFALLLLEIDLIRIKMLRTLEKQKPIYRVDGKS